MLLLSPRNWPDYELIDSGNFEKLERFGAYFIARPEPKALWNKSLSEKEWNALTHTRFETGAGFGKAGKEESGTWKMLKKMPEQWLISYQSSVVSPESLAVSRESSVVSRESSAVSRESSVVSPESSAFQFKIRLGLTAFKHVGLFPEQAPNWDFIYKATSRLASNPTSNSSSRPTSNPPSNSSSRLTSNPTSNSSSRPTSTSCPPKILNLFAYTGCASLAARAAGADVTHLDAVRQVVTWARENMELSNMDGIRWMVEDALKFVKRQVRRNAQYQGIILDPPAYGHGPEGERWKLDECLFELLQACNAILSPHDSFMLLNLYSNGYSAVLADSLARASFGQAGTGSLSDCAAADRLSGPAGYAAAASFGELILEDKFGKRLPLSVFARIER